MKAFTGIDDPYEIPESPDIIIETDNLNLSESVEKIIDYLNANGIIEDTAILKKIGETAP